MFRHQVQFYDSDAFLVKTVCEFVGSAQRAGDGAIVIATAEHLDRLQALLGGTSSAAPRDEKDHFVLLDARETLATFMVDGQPDEQRFVAVVGGLMRQISDSGSRHVSAFGEMVAVLYAQGNGEAAIRLERLWEKLAEQHRFSLLCAYPLNAFPDDGHRHAFQCICAAHSHVNPIERLHGAGAEPEALHRTIALLQQQANALESELRRREDYQRVLESQGRAGCAGEVGLTFLTVEAAASKLRLSRPHVLKLIAEKRLESVVQQDGGTLLIPEHEVGRVAEEMCALARDRFATGRTARSPAPSE